MFEKLFGKKETEEENKELNVREDGSVETERLRALDKGFEENKGPDPWREQK